MRIVDAVQQVGFVVADAVRSATDGPEPKHVVGRWSHQPGPALGLPEAALERSADADAYQDLGLDRRKALWAVRGLADSTLPLFAQVDGSGRPLPEAVEPPVALTKLKDRREVVEHYRSIGLSLRRHPVAFLRERSLAWA